MFIAHVVAHTHWDREWYQPHVRFRQRLIALVDELLDDPPVAPASFLLDGQAIVLEDYLAVRPERAAELSALLQQRRLEAGPWYVLADELIPSAEALVRNLLVGRRVLRALRAEAPPVLYCPDSFGHPAALPTLAVGFGLSLIILWRGFGGPRVSAGDVVRFRAPDGSSVVLFHLPRDGYEFGAQLPPDEAGAIDRWTRIRAELGGRSLAGVLLIQNGADHHARQHRQREAVDALARAARATGDEVRGSSLSAFASELVSRVGTALPEVHGELRDSYGYTWTLQGTFASRAAQKRRNAHAERALLRDAEPWAALARRAGGASRASLLVAAWKTLLQAHPHDTLCGCSIDAVADAMDLRMRDALVQARGIREDALADLIGYDAEVARARTPQWRPIVLVRNRAARPRGGLAFIEIKHFVAHVPVGPGSAPSVTPQPTAAEPRMPTGSGIQVLSRRTEHDRLESARHYPDNDLVVVARAALWIEPVAGYGVTSISLSDLAALARAAPPHPVRVTAREIDNGLVRVAVGDTGDVTFEELGVNRRIESLLAIEDRVDGGDLYTPSIGATAARAEFLDARVTQQGPLVGELTLRWRLVDATKRSTRRVRGWVTVRLGVHAGARCLRLRVAGENRASNHRLRVAVRTGVTGPDVWADAAFGSVRRAPIDIPDEHRRLETPPPTAPLHRYVSLFDGVAGATVYSDGLAEYEATAAGEVVITLLRAVGELSRNDLPERPGHAGWPVPTPGAQSHGPFVAELALLLHGGRSASVLDAIERTADDVLLPLHGTTLRAALELPPPTRGVELRGEGLAFSSLKDAESGEGIVARCVNLLDTPVEGSWLFGVAIREAHRARLDETVLESLPVSENAVSFIAPPRSVVTLVVR